MYLSHSYLQRLLKHYCNLQHTRVKSSISNNSAFKARSNKQHSLSRMPFYISQIHRRTRPTHQKEKCATYQSFPPNIAYHPATIKPAARIPRLSFNVITEELWALQTHVPTQRQCTWASDASRADVHCIGISCRMMFERISVSLFASEVRSLLC